MLRQVKLGAIIYGLVASSITGPTRNSHFGEMIVFPVIFIKSLIQIIVEELGSSRLQRGDILLL